MISKFIKGKVFICIDAANLESSVKDLGWWIDYIKLKELFDGCKLLEMRNYCVAHHTANQDNFFTFLKKNGFVLSTKPLKIIKAEEIKTGDIRKANFDVEISVDAMESQKDFETFVLFSGDSDFHYLLFKLREKGKKVIVVSAKNHIAKELIEVSNKYIDLKKLRKFIERTNKQQKGPSFATGS